MKVELIPTPTEITYESIRQYLDEMGYKRDDIDYIWNMLQWYHPISQHFNGSNDTISK